jgi:hypothetical protein
MHTNTMQSFTRGAMSVLALTFSLVSFSTLTCEGTWILSGEPTSWTNPNGFTNSASADNNFNWGWERDATSFMNADDTSATYGGTAYACCHITDFQGDGGRTLEQSSSGGNNVAWHWQGNFAYPSTVAVRISLDGLLEISGMNSGDPDAPPFLCISGAGAQGAAGVDYPLTNLLNVAIHGAETNLAGSTAVSGQPSVLDDDGGLAGVAWCAEWYRTIHFEMSGEVGATGVMGGSIEVNPYWEAVATADVYLMQYFDAEHGGDGGVWAVGMANISALGSISIAPEDDGG